MTDDGRAARRRAAAGRPHAARPVAARCAGGRAAAVAAASSLAVLVGSGVGLGRLPELHHSIPHGAAGARRSPPGTQDIDGNDQNILLIGNDSRAGATPAELKALATGNDGGSVNTDTMMVLHVPANGSRRDDRLVPARLLGRHPRQRQGQDQLGLRRRLQRRAARTAQSEIAAESAGIDPDHQDDRAAHRPAHRPLRAGDLLGFYRISNAIGGVTVCLNAAQNPNTDCRRSTAAATPASTCPRASRRSRARRRWRSCGSGTGCPTATSTGSSASSTSCPPPSARWRPPGVLLNPFKLHDLLHAVGSSLLTDPGLDLLSLARQFESDRQRQHHLPRPSRTTARSSSTRTASRRRSSRSNTAAMPGVRRQLDGQVRRPGARRGEGGRAAPR